MLQGTVPPFGLKRLVTPPQNREEVLLALALEIPADKRPAFLDAVCEADSSLRRRLEDKLAAHGQPADSPPEATHNATPTIKVEPTDGADLSVGQTIGRYKLLEKIGEGGCGMVYVAEQTEPVRRRVALKVIKLGMDTKQVVARFEAERQALAMMDHANIAKVLDAGSTDAGRPYFVMELVRGIRITDYCDQSNLTTRQRLDLFIKVCHAIQHAHQKGIIHRDIKPSNILVTLHDGEPVPKVIDFGIAKATEGRLTDATVYTQLHQFIGTPAYMSPEQVEMSGLDIDTRSDIYSLGVLLYELLVGTPPFDPFLLVNSGLDTMRRTIREIEPVRPSTRFTSLKGDELTTTAKRRSCPPARLIQLVKGDLDWIVMKCLEKDRRRRYETANGLAMDIHRHLTGEPVQAAPPSAAYRFNKFLHRNRGQVIAAGVVAVALVLGMIGTVWQASVASTERDKARSETARAVAAESETKRRAQELQRVADFQGAMLAQVDPASAGVRLGQDIRARFDESLVKAALPDKDRQTQTESFAGQWSRVNATDTALELIDSTILKPAAAAIDKQFTNQPVVAATLRHVLAERYHDLGLNNPALALEKQALAERKQALGAEHPDTLLAIGNLGVYLNSLGKLDEAEPYYREALEKSSRVRGTNDPETLNCLANMGTLLMDKSKFNEAEPFLREALDKRRRVLGEDHPETLTSLRDWGSLQREQGKLAAAESTLREVLAKRRRILEPDDGKILTSANDLAVTLKSEGKFDEAIVLFREVTDNRRRVLGDAHPSTLTAIQNLGATLDAGGHPAEAESLMREALAKQRQLLGSDHTSTLTTLGNFTVFLIGQDKFTEAEPLCRETLERRQRVLGPDHTATLIANNVMGLVLIRQGKLAEGEPFWRSALATSRRVLGPAHPETLIYLHNLAGLASDQKKTAEAEQLYREVLQTGTPAVGPGHPVVLSATRRLAAIALDQKRYAEVVELLSGAEPQARKAYTGPNERNVAALLKNLGGARARLQQFAAAETNLLEAHAIYVKTRGETHADTRVAMQTLVDFYSLWNESDPGHGHDTTGADWKKKLDAIPAPASEKKP